MTVTQKNDKFLKYFFEKNGKLKVTKQFCFDLNFWIKKDYLDNF